MTQSTHEKIVRVGAIYDILAMAPFALPMVSVWAYSMIQWVDQQLGFNSRFSTLDPTAMFLLNIGAWAYLVWGFVRWRAPHTRTCPSQRLAARDRSGTAGIGRQRWRFAFLAGAGCRSTVAGGTGVFPQIIRAQRR